MMRSKFFMSMLVVAFVTLSVFSVEAKIHVADDFNGDALDTSIWAVKGFDPNQIIEYTVSDGKLNMPKYDGCIWLETKQEFSDFVARARIELALPFLIYGDNHIEVQAYGANTSITIDVQEKKISLRLPESDWLEPKECIIDFKFKPRKTYVFDVVLARIGEETEALIYEIAGDGDKSLVGHMQYTAPRIEASKPSEEDYPRFEIVQWQFAGTMSIDHVVIGDSIEEVEAYVF